MKKGHQVIQKALLVIVISICASFFQTAIGQNILFQYDESGNRDRRYIASARVEGENEQVAEQTEDVLEEDKLYPNPTEGILRFSLIREEPAISQVSLIDLNGRLLYRKTFTEQDFEINISNRPEGIYILKWTFADQSRSIKIIKQ